MLVLTRRTGEGIVIASDIRLTVVAVNGKKVRLGITAPSSVPVARRELLVEHFGAYHRQQSQKPGKTRDGAGVSEGASTQHRVCRDYPRR